MDETVSSCVKCGNQTENGFVMDQADLNYPLYPQWVQGEPEKSFWSGFKITDREIKIIDKVLRCRNCGFLEFYATRTE